MECRLHPPPHALGVGGVPPGRADLGGPSSVPNGQFAKDLREDLGEQLADVRPLLVLLLLLLSRRLLLLEARLVVVRVMGMQVVVEERRPGRRTTRPDVVVHVRQLRSGHRGVWVEGVQETVGQQELATLVWLVQVALGGAIAAALVHRG